MTEALDNPARLTLVIGACLYASAFLTGLLPLLLRRSYLPALVSTLTTLGFALQTIGLNLRGLEVKGCPLGNAFEIAQFIIWSVVLLYFIVGPAFRIRLLGFFVAALAAFGGFASLIPGLDRPYPADLSSSNPWIELHATLALFSYGLFALVALVALMFLIQRHGLKQKKFRGIYQYLPSVEKLDTMGRRLLLASLLGLTAALLFGAIFYLRNSHLVPVFKLSVTCLVWAGYLGVAILQLQGRLVTRRHAIASILLFLLALLALWPVQDARHLDEPATPLPPEAPTNL
ncbi:MAG: cytochrome c biogenesis protein CcsA [Coraliomargaritaceae bacterium]